MGFSIVNPPTSGLVRVGRWPDPFQWWAPANALEDSDEPLLEGSRWDDAEGLFQALYAATSAVGALTETLAAFRQVPGLVERIVEETSEDEPEAEHDFDLAADIGRVPAAWFAKRVLARCQVDPSLRMVDVDASQTHNVLNAEYGTLLRDLKIAAQFDRGVVMQADRRITRKIATFIHDHPSGPFDGIRYESRLAGDLECWAFWRPPVDAFPAADIEPIMPTSPDAIRAAEILGIELPRPEEVPMPESAGGA